MSQASAGADEIQVFNSFNPVSIFDFLSAFELACDTNKVHERFALWRLQVFMKCPAATLLKARIALKSKSHNRQIEGTPTSYCEAVPNLFEMFAKNNLVAEKRRYDGIRSSMS